MTYDDHDCRVCGVPFATRSDRIGHHVAHHLSNLPSRQVRFPARSTR